MNKTDQAFIEAYREGRDDASNATVRVLKADDMAKVIGANSPIELSFESPSKNIVLQSAPAQRGLPLNRKHSRHKKPPAPHAAEIKQMAEATAVEDAATLQNAIATGNDLATDPAIANSNLAAALPGETATPEPAIQSETEVEKSVEANSETKEQAPGETVTDIAEPADEITDETTDEPQLDPMWEVDAFEWSPVCRRIHEAGAKVLPNLQWVEACNPGVLAVGSIRRQSGATTAAICLARHIADGGKNVLVIDAHFEHAQLAEQLGVKAPACWREKLIAEEPLAKATITSVADRLTILPLTSSEAIDVAGRKLVQRAINEAGRAYDFTIVDVGVIDNESPFGGGDSCFGGVLIVRDLRHDDDKSVTTTLQSAKTLGDNIAVIENFAD